MKKLIATTLASTLLGLAAYAQGTITFANLGVGLNAPITLNDGTTKAGSGYMAQLLAGPVGGSLAAVGSAAAIGTGVPAGYFNGGVITIPTVAPATLGAFAVEVWNSTAYGSFAAAQASGLKDAWGESGYNYATGTLTPFTAFTGGAGTPQGPPGNLAGGVSGSSGLSAFSLSPATVPEPSTFALAGLGAAALLIFRRRK